MLWPKKNSYKEFDNEKKFLRLENSPPPPHNFSNGPSLSRRFQNDKLTRNQVSKRGCHIADKEYVAAVVITSK